jgi:hypothetical protein
MNLGVPLVGIAACLLASRVQAVDLRETVELRSQSEATYEFVLVEPSGRLRAEGHSFWLKGVKLPRTTICRSSSGRPWGCGTASFVAWSHIFRHGPVICSSEISQGNVRSCFIDNKDVAVTLLASGWGIRDAAASNALLERAESLGKEEKRGIWSSDPH